MEHPGSGQVRAGYEFDEARLSAWLAQHVSGYQGPLRVEQFTGGQSNPTYKLITPERSYVLRRKPPGPLLKGAHAIEREAKVQQALVSVGFPVPTIHALCMDEQVIGTAFYVMELVAGRIFWDASFANVSREQRPAHFDAMSTTLATLHRVDYKAVGLAEYGASAGFVQRQLARWSRQYLQDSDAGRDDNMDRLIEWLQANLPADDETTLVHGDYRCDNIIFHSIEPRVVAVLDWELSTLGHPLVDFAYHAMMYRMPPEVAGGLALADLRSLNIPSERQYIESYCRHVGRMSIDAYEFYMVFSIFRLAAILHGIKGRVQRGTAVSASARDRAQLFPMLAEIGLRQVMDLGV